MDEAQVKALIAVDLILDKVIEELNKPALNYIEIESLARTAIDLYYNFRPPRVDRGLE